MLEETIINNTYSLGNYEITFPAYPFDMQWSQVPKDKLHSIQVYYPAYIINEQPVTPEVNGFKLHNESGSLYLASCLIYHAPCLNNSTSKNWFELSVNCLSNQTGYMNNFKLLSQKEERLHNAKAHCFHAHVNIGNSPMYQLGYVVTLNGFLYEIHFMTKSDFYLCWKQTFDEIIKSFEINLKRHSFIPSMFS